MKTTYRADRDGNVTREGSVEESREIKSLREIHVPLKHCGKNMRKTQHPSPSTGEMVTVHACDECGKQERS